MIALSADQSSVWTFFYNAIVSIYTSNNAQYKQPYSLIRTPYLVIISSNVIFKMPHYDTLKSPIQIVHVSFGQADLNSVN